MHVAATSLLIDSYHHSSKCFSSVVLQFQPISFIQYKILFTGYLCCSSYLYVYCIQFVNQFIPLLNPNHWYQSGPLLIYFSSCMSPTRSGYKKLGLEPIESLQYRSHRARKQPMGDEKKYYGSRDPFKMFL
jgi:hypothetical protein